MSIRYLLIFVCISYSIQSFFNNNNNGIDLIYSNFAEKYFKQKELNIYSIVKKKEIQNICHDLFIQGNNVEEYFFDLYRIMCDLFFENAPDELKIKEINTYITKDSFFAIGNRAVEIKLKILEDEYSKSKLEKRDL